MKKNVREFVKHGGVERMMKLLESVNNRHAKAEVDECMYILFRCCCVVLCCAVLFCVVCRINDIMQLGYTRD